jgi:hypothetical protein
MAGYRRTDHAGNQAIRQELNSTKQTGFPTREEWMKADLLNEITRIDRKVGKEETDHTKDKDQI